MDRRGRDLGAAPGHSSGASFVRAVSPVILLGLPLVARVLFPSPMLVPYPWSYVGLPVLVAGLAYMLWAWELFKARGTTLRLNEPSALLITSGPYRFSRNPMYAGALVAILGFCVLLSSAAGFLFPVLYFLVADRFMVRPEERALRQRFGEQYAAYKRRVRRWL